MRTWITPWLTLRPGVIAMAARTGRWPGRRGARQRPLAVISGTSRPSRVGGGHVGGRR
ncbi:MAG TPA: hypothetical protein VIJ00_08170 [Nakamurella sp.]